MAALTTADFLSPVLRDMPPEWDAVEAELLTKLVPRYGIYTPWQYEQLERIAKSRWYLLRNDGPVAAPARCRRCGARHAYYTTACVERPLHGLQDLMAVVRRVVGMDVLIESIPLGTIEPISAGEAAQLWRRIQSRAPQARAWKEAA